MTLYKFATKYTVGERTQHRNKIKLHQRNKNVICFCSNVRCQKQAQKDYKEYCCYSVIK